jgi:hypothetical protein
VAEAKAKRGRINLVTRGRQLPHFAQLSLQTNTGAKLMNIPYSGTAPTGKRCSLASSTSGSSPSPMRLPTCARPDPLAGTGGAAMLCGGAPDADLARTGRRCRDQRLRGVAVPAGAPAPILRVLSDAMAAVVRSPEASRRPRRRRCQCATSGPRSSRLSWSGRTGNTEPCGACRLGKTEVLGSKDALPQEDS